MTGVALATLSFVGTIVAARNGPRKGADPVTYLSAGRNFAEGQGLVDFTGEPLTVFAPGFPTVLAAGEWIGVGAGDAAVLVNAIGYALTVLFTLFLLRRHLASKRIIVGATSLVAISPILLDLADTALSEPLFIACTLAFLLALERAVDERRDSWWSIVFLALLVWLAFLLRYAGAVLIPTGVVVLVLTASRGALKAAAARAVAFATLAAIGPILWVVRNVSTGSDDLLGPRSSRDVGPVRLASEFTRVIGGVLAPARAPTLLRAAFLVTLLGFFAALALLWARTRRSEKFVRPRSTTVTMIVFVVLYVLFCIVSSKTSGINLQRRILSPIYVPLVILGAAGVERLVVQARDQSVRMARAVVVVAVAWIVGVAAVWAWVVWDDGRTDHAQDATGGSSSALVRAVSGLESDAVVLTNEPWDLADASGHEPVTFGPGRLVPTLTHRPPTIADVEDEVACGDAPVYLAWFGSLRESRSFLVAPVVLRRHFTLTPERDVDNGTLLRIELPSSGFPRRIECDR